MRVSRSRNTCMVLLCYWFNCYFYWNGGHLWRAQATRGARAWRSRKKTHAHIHTRTDTMKERMKRTFQANSIKIKMNLMWFSLSCTHNNQPLNGENIFMFIVHTLIISMHCEIENAIQSIESNVFFILSICEMKKKKWNWKAPHRTLTDLLTHCVAEIADPIVRHWYNSVAFSSRILFCRASSSAFFWWQIDVDCIQIEMILVIETMIFFSLSLSHSESE